VLVHPSVVPLFEFLMNFWFLFLKIFQYQRTISFGSLKNIKTKEPLTSFNSRTLKGLWFSWKMEWFYDQLFVFCKILRTMVMFRILIIGLITVKGLFLFLITSKHWFTLTHLNHLELRWDSSSPLPLLNSTSCVGLGVGTFKAFLIILPL
jgi:hypothetical protein